MSDKFKREDFERLSTYFIACEAQKLKLPIKKVIPHSKKSLLEIEIDGRKYVIVGQRSPFLTFSAYHSCKNKYLTKILLQSAGIRTPEGAVFEKKDADKARQYAEAMAKPFVIKPVDGLHGDDVFVGVSTSEEIGLAFDRIFGQGRRVLIEEQVSGIEYRVMASRHELLSVIRRVPANVKGNGTHTIGELIDRKNADPRRGDYSCALIEIRKDDALIAKLGKEGYTLDTVPGVDETVSLRETSNLSAGGDSIDVSDRVHANLKKLAPAIIRAVPGLSFGGIDFMIDDIASDPLGAPYAVIEVNSSPMISMHHEPYQGEGRNVARQLVKEMIADAQAQHTLASPA